MSMRGHGAMPPLFLLLNWSVTSFRKPCVCFHHKTDQLCHAWTECSVEFKHKSWRCKMKQCFKDWHLEGGGKQREKYANRSTAKSAQSTASNCSSAHPEGSCTALCRFWCQHWDPAWLSRSILLGDHSSNEGRAPLLTCTQPTQCHYGGGCHSLTPECRSQWALCFSRVHPNTPPTAPQPALPACSCTSSGSAGTPGTRG